MRVKEPREVIRHGGAVVNVGIETAGTMAGMEHIPDGETLRFHACDSAGVGE